ncbi:hypothetical protein BDZ91DRAFT_9772 [Kalaharituber pfeilii]|nr:hypothetical protein BDZ91DRAFT_9772 [Kalaharituber pfeilii]
MERLRLHLPSKLFHHQGGSVMIRTAHPDPSEAQSSFRQEYCRQQRLPGDVLPPQFQGEALPNTRATLAETPASPPSLHAKDEITLRGATSRFLNAANLPVELLSIILEFIAFERAGGTLRDCASTCQLWSSVALPLLYRYCGFGVFDYMPPQPCTG